LQKSGSDYADAENADSSYSFGYLNAQLAQAFISDQTVLLGMKILCIETTALLLLFIAWTFSFLS